MIHEPSIQSVLLLLFFRDRKLGYATGFVVNRPNGSPMLITNWHVVSGRHLHTRKTLDSQSSIPDRIGIYHNKQNQLATWELRTELLYDELGQPRWLEHPIYGSRVDVVGLPLSELSGVDFYPYSYDGLAGHDASNFPEGLLWGPSDPINIIGFPFGETAGGAFGIWVQGTVASEPDFNYSNLPSFLIDSRTRPGQSGSPVIIYRRSGISQKPDGSAHYSGNPLSLLVGVYSGRINAESDLGIVWKTSLVKDIADAGVQGIET